MTQQAAQIVLFPFPKRDWNTCETYRESVFQLKLEAAQMLNDVAAGTYIMSEENIQAVKNVDRMCLEVGLTPLGYALPE